MFILAVLTSFWNLTEERRKKEEEHLRLLDLSASPQVKRERQVNPFLLIGSSALIGSARVGSGHQGPLLDPNLT